MLEDHSPSLQKMGQSWCSKVGLYDLPPPSPAHLSSLVDVLSKMSKSRVHLSLSKGHVSHTIKFVTPLSTWLINPPKGMSQCT